MLMAFLASISYQWLSCILGQSDYFHFCISLVLNYSRLAKLLYEKLNNLRDWISLEEQSSSKKLCNRCWLILIQMKYFTCKLMLQETLLQLFWRSRIGRLLTFVSVLWIRLRKKKDIIELEALQVFPSLRVFLLGRHFKILSYHCSLRFLLNKDQCNSKLAEWRLKLQLQEFDFEVIYWRGEKNVAADCLRRLNSLDFEGMTILREERTSTYCATVQWWDASNGPSHSEKCVSDGLWRMKAALVVKDNILKSRRDHLFVPNSIRSKP